MYNGVCIGGALCVAHEMHKAIMDIDWNVYDVYADH